MNGKHPADKSKKVPGNSSFDSYRCSSFLHSPVPACACILSAGLGVLAGANGLLFGDSARNRLDLARARLANWTMVVSGVASGFAVRDVSGGRCWPVELET